MQCFNRLPTLYLTTFDQSHSFCNFVHRPNTPYTEAVLHEVLRLGNILPKTVGQRALADGLVRLKDGKEEYFVPKGADIKWNLGAVLKDPRYFPKPDSFDPKRYRQGFLIYILNTLFLFLFPFQGTCLRTDRSSPPTPR